ncbi:hypothetical protein CEP54_014300 [Fusarium duplospermum]|uniref:Uncharacterized protein n=1 Tax=Fusarium duplospermum TaxID=1325734 RepID=A0A428NXA0_9HYPO|nr:hypothetical protein CEP54_014300 [Fusarium duplospermum]
MPANPEGRAAMMVHLILRPIIFLLAIFAFLVVDVYHRTRRVWRSARYGNRFANFVHYLLSRAHPYEQFSTQDEISRGYYYQWRVGTMLRVHMEDVVTVGLYLFVFLAVCVFLGLCVILYWLAKWLF